MHRPIAVNLVRSLTGAMHQSVRGVDRIDFGLLSHLIDHWPNDVFGVMPTPWGNRYFPRERLVRGREVLARLRREGAEDSNSDDPGYRRLLAMLEGARAGALPRQRRHLTGFGLRRAARLLLEGGVMPGRPVRRLPAETLYLDLGHYGLSYDAYVRWLVDRPDVCPIFLLHDMIPLQRPDLCEADTVRAHRKAVAATLRYARAVLVSTASAGAAAREVFARRGRADLPIHALSLPLDDAFLRRPPPDQALSRHRYFLALGSIERRKNLLLLAAVWEDLAARLGAATPRLILAGSPGFDSAPIIRRFQESPALARHVLIVSNLATASIVRLMAQARAVLMPSLAEGFGLPPVEAMALGTPALLSDIGAHRDAAGEHGVFLDPADSGAWADAIARLSVDEAAYAALRGRVATFRPTDWPAYMARVSDLLTRLDPRTGTV